MKMLRAILIDDEALALDLLERKLNKLSNIHILGKFTNPHAGLIEIAKLEPELVFIDVEMPEANGINITREIIKALPTTQVIFVTAHKKYAVEAFELQVKDYILKPFTDERLKNVLEKLEQTAVKETIAEQMICCFQKLSFYDHGVSEKSIEVRWRTAKAKEIFAYLLHHHGNEVRKDDLITMFWPGSIDKNAYAQLYTAIYHIRTILRRIQFPIDLVSSKNGYELKLYDTKIDIDLFQQGVEKGVYITDYNITQHREVLDLYKGDYFAFEDYEWAENKKNRLHFLLVNYLKRIASYYVEKENYDEAISMYLQLQKKLPYHEENYLELMKLFLDIGDRHAIEEYYDKLKNALKKINKQPNSVVQGWYEQHI